MGPRRHDRAPCSRSLGACHKKSTTLDHAAYAWMGFPAVLETFLNHDILEQAIHNRLAGVLKSFLEARESAKLLVHTESDMRLLWYQAGLSRAIPLFRGSRGKDL